MCIRFGLGLTESTKSSCVKDDLEIDDAMLSSFSFSAYGVEAQDSPDLEINQNVFVYPLELFQCSQTMLHTTFKWD